jgi:hypothetical protein
MRISYGSAIKSWVRVAVQSQEVGTWRIPPKKTPSDNRQLSTAYLLTAAAAIITLTMNTRFKNAPATKLRYSVISSIVLCKKHYLPIPQARLLQIITTVH